MATMVLAFLSPSTSPTNGCIYATPGRSPWALRPHFRGTYLSYRQWIFAYNTESAVLLQNTLQQFKWCELHILMWVELKKKVIERYQQYNQYDVIC